MMKWTPEKIRPQIKNRSFKCVQHEVIELYLHSCESRHDTNRRGRYQWGLRITFRVGKFHYTVYRHSPRSKTLTSDKHAQRWAARCFGELSLPYGKLSRG